MSNNNLIYTALAKKYTADDWKIFFELRDSPGFSSKQTRYIDAWAINVYPSHGFLTLAFEVKVSRGDFLNELKNPDKRKFAMSVSNEFYFVAPNGMIKNTEIPEGLGLLEVYESGEIRTKIKATYRNHEDTFPISFFASICRRENKEPVLKRQLIKYVDKNISLEELDNIVSKEMETGNCTYLKNKVEIRAKDIASSILKEHEDKIKKINKIYSIISTDLFNYYWNEKNEITENNIKELEKAVLVLKSAKQIRNSIDYVRQSIDTILINFDEINKQSN